MAKKIQGYIKLQIPAGGANPSPPVGPALGQQGVNIMEFCKAFNAKTQQHGRYHYSCGDNGLCRSFFQFHYQKHLRLQSF